MTTVQLSRTRTTYKKVTTVTAAVLTGLLAALSLPGHAFDLNDSMLTSKTPYSATQTTKVDNETIAMKVYKEGEKLRMDINEEGQRISVIMRLDKETNYTLMHDMAIYQEVKSGGIEQFRSDMDTNITNQQEVGTEQMNGYECTKYTADFSGTDGTTGSGTFWVNSDEIVVRAVMTAQEGNQTVDTVMDLTDLDVSDQPDELFEVPEGYQSFGLEALMRQSLSE